jgi:hypothetical protein
MDGTRLLKGDHAKQPLSLRDVVNKIIHGAPAYVMVRDGVMELNLHGETTTQPGEIELMLQLSDVARHDRSRSAGNGFELPLIGMCGNRPAGPANSSTQFIDPGNWSVTGAVLNLAAAALLTYEHPDHLDANAVREASVLWRGTSTSHGGRAAISSPGGRVGGRIRGGPLRSRGDGGERLAELTGDGSSTLGGMVGYTVQMSRPARSSLRRLRVSIRPLIPSMVRSSSVKRMVHP